MFLSVFEIFKIGLGPSSSHTVGPMIAASRFMSENVAPNRERISSVSVSLHGSLAFTGKGHATDRAVVLGLAGERPDLVEPDAIEQILESVARNKTLERSGFRSIAFDPANDVRFDYGPALPAHPNGMTFNAFGPGSDVVASRIFYSVGGGFVVASDEIADEQRNRRDETLARIPYPFQSAREMLRMGASTGLSIAAMKRANEVAASNLDLDERLDALWQAMASCIDRGLGTGGILPGGLQVKRRARAIYEKLKTETNRSEPHRVMDWLSVFAMAVNEENAAGARVVTAPTNGAAGVIPAVIRYYVEMCADANAAGVRTFLLVAAAVGGLIKHSASISGAEVGCQGEVGSASAMAAAGLAAALGGTNEQIENAAEIALEHHLGMTCDPVGGLVQIPCIERNAFGAIKAVSSASLALQGDGSHIVQLDDCIRTMRDTGRDMSAKYKETSQGGLAVNVVAC
jgi:L-serine dehydratase